MKFLTLKILVVIGFWAITEIKFRKNAKSFKLYDFARFSPICNVYMNRCREIIRFRTFIMVDRAAKCWGVKTENMKKTLSGLQNDPWPMIKDSFSCIFSVSALTPQMRGFVFSNYRILNKWNLLLESGEILKQKWH